MLAWWRHVAPRGSRLRVVCVWLGEELLGIAPLFVEPGPAGLARYRVLGRPGLLRVEPLAIPGSEGQVALGVAEALATATPPADVISFEAIPDSSPWPQLLQRKWPGSKRPWLHSDRSGPAPTLLLRDRTFEEWFGGKSRNFRHQMRRAQRHLTRGGARFELITAGENLNAGLRAFSRLHHGRWRSRGGSRVLTSPMERMLRDVAETLSGSLRFRLWTLRVDDRVISAHLFAAAGGEVSYWLGGFDERWARDHPSMVTILAAAEHAWSVGDERLDLGGGGHGYKYRFADGEDRLQWTTLISPGPRSGRARVILAPGRVRSAVTQHLPEGTKLRIRATMGKLRSWLRRSVRVS